MTPKDVSSAINCAVTYQDRAPLKWNHVAQLLCQYRMIVLQVTHRRARKCRARSLSQSLRRICRQQC